MPALGNHALEIPSENLGPFGKEGGTEKQDGYPKPRSLKVNMSEMWKHTEMANSATRSSFWLGMNVVLSTH